MRACQHTAPVACMCSAGMNHLRAAGSTICGLCKVIASAHLAGVQIVLRIAGLPGQGSWQPLVWRLRPSTVMALCKADWLVCAGRLLCEVHEEYSTNIELAKRGFWVTPCLYMQAAAHSGLLPPPEEHTIACPASASHHLTSSGGSRSAPALMLSACDAGVRLRAATAAAARDHLQDGRQHAQLAAHLPQAPDHRAGHT